MACCGDTYPALVTHTHLFVSSAGSLECQHAVLQPGEGGSCKAFTAGTGTEVTVALSQ